ncbi:hypothetical protein OHB26_01120 [Nocardia sp. NBC_01503]|uniref:hypothetical protein n=1 Tax=Nocardia sp. NBC_01503 TaxID=2975997 RepID=UPI002E7AD49D|nr:hypothetical protein [Nocardia sp. NBC_01503]WTL32893.1 hypothetical protein OHB26_01120 [Nocardia sp. NBC_01503]
MAIERLGGNPDDPSRQPDPDSSANTPAQPTGDESRISASDSGPEPTSEAEVNPVTGRAWGTGGRPIRKRDDGSESPDPRHEATTDPSSAPAESAEHAESPEHTAPSGAPATEPTVEAAARTSEFATPPTFELPVPPVYPPAPSVPMPAPEPRRGSVQRQQAGVTAPRPPTVAEARAREKARKRAEEAERAAAEAEDAKKAKKKKLLIGGAAVVGVAALVGGGYLAYDALTTPEVTAYCTVVAKQGQVVAVGNGQTITATKDNQEIVVPDNYCDDAKRTGSSGLGGIFILNGSQYRYYYGGSGNTIGHAPTGGTTVLPKGADVKTKSGSTIQRGGLGSKIGGGS